MKGFHVLIQTQWVYGNCKTEQEKIHVSMSNLREVLFTPAFNYEALPSSAVVHVKLVCIHSTFAFQGHYNWKTMENNEKTNAIHMLHSYDHSI